MSDREELRNQLVALLEQRGFSLATAESCTAGSIASYLGSFAGASVYLQGGIVAYQESAKERLLGVDPEVIATCHVVSPEVAEAMAEGVLPALSADLGIATTGLAGPGGADETHPVGMICLAAALSTGRGLQTLGRTLYLDGDRASNIDTAVTEALRLALELLQRAEADLHE